MVRICVMPFCDLPGYYFVPPGSHLLGEVTSARAPPQTKAKQTKRCRAPRGALVYFIYPFLKSNNIGCRVLCVAHRMTDDIANSTRTPSRRQRERTPQNAPRIRAGATKKDQKAELKRTKRAGAIPSKPRFLSLIPLITEHTPGARRGITEGQQRNRTRRADRSGDVNVRGEVTRDRNTENHRRPVLLRTTQRPRSANNKTTTTTARHPEPELRDPLPDSSDDRSRGMACSLFERH